MAKTYQLTAAAAPAPGTPVIVKSSSCTKVTVKVNPGVAGWPEPDFLVSKPTVTDIPVRTQAGGIYVFDKPAGYFFRENETAGYLNGVSVSPLMDVDES